MSTSRCPAPAAGLRSQRTPLADALAKASLSTLLLVAGGAVLAQQQPAPVVTPTNPTTPTAPATVSTGAAAAPAAAPGQEPAPIDTLNIKPVRYGSTYFTPAFDARAVYTNNPGPDEQTNTIHRDTVVEVQPSVVFERHGPRIDLTGNVAVSFIDYMQDSHPSRVLPRGHIGLATKVVENLLFFDAELRSDPTFEDPFVTTPGDDTSYRLQPRTRYTLSPYIATRFGDAGALLARSDYSVTRITQVSGNDRVKTQVRALENTVTFGREPRPFGYSLEARTRDESDDSVDQVLIKEKNARLWLDYALDPQFSVGVDGGYEDVTFTSGALKDSFYGARVRWRPTDRTDLRLMVEQRYFGKGWDFSFDHRSPFLNVNFRSVREVSSQDVPQFTIGAGDDISAALNGMLTGTFPNAADRQQEVNRIIAERGLPALAGSALTFYSRVPQLRQNASATIGLRGVRNLIFVQYGYLKAEAIGDDVLAVVSNDVREQRIALGWNLRLTRLAVVSVIGDVIRVERISGAASGQYTSQRTLRGEMLYLLTPHSSATFGVRKRDVGATEGLLNSNDLAGEKAVYVGVRYRF